jgi:integrase/recombinase XerD
MATATVSLPERWPALAAVPPALAWLGMRADLGLAPRTLDAYAQGLSEYLAFCADLGADPLLAGREHVARFVRHLTERPARHAGAASSFSGRPSLSNATVQQRLTAVRLFYDHLVEEGLRDTNPVGRGKYAPGARTGGSGHQRGLVPRQVRLPWIPDEAEWRVILEAARGEPIRNRAMLALGYDAGLRREELCALRTDDLDPGHRLLRVRAETTKGRRERVVPYSAAAGELLRLYLLHRAGISRARGPLFLSESRRNRAEPLTPWTWSKVVRRIALAAGVPCFGTHALRHLCLTDLARAGWELHAIATFAGHRDPATTMQYVHLSGRDLAGKLARCMGASRSMPRSGRSSPCCGDGDTSKVEIDRGCDQRSASSCWPIAAPTSTTSRTTRCCGCVAPRRPSGASLGRCTASTARSPRWATPRRPRLPRRIRRMTPSPPSRLG